jgi:hypothetical protein
MDIVRALITTDEPACMESTDSAEWLPGIGVAAAPVVVRITWRFNRTSIFGLSDKKWGTLTFGRQYDTLFDLVVVDPPRFNSVTAVHVGNWDRKSDVCVNNSIKYRSPKIAFFGQPPVCAIGRRHPGIERPRG